jgi:hypothetical protein
VVGIALAACGPFATGGPGCQPVGASARLPEALVESSGVAVSLRHPGVYWTHGDGSSDLFAVDRRGAVLARFPVRPATRDWEDLALSACGDGGACLYLADLGDNYEERPFARILRVAEPDPSASGDPLRAAVFPVRFPDGARDVEALLVLPGERVLVVTKGRNHPVTVYRYPGPLRPDTVVLREVQRLTDEPPSLPRRVTGGSVSPGGGLAVLRTYESLRFYDVRSDTLVPARGGLVNLRPLAEAQGEGVGIGRDGEVVLTSEGGPLGGPGSMAWVRCRLGGL